MGKEELKEKLEIIKNLKKEHYLGTQELYNYMEDIFEMFTRPDELVKKINKNLPLEDKITTPKLIGTCQIVDYLVSPSGRPGCDNTGYEREELINKIGNVPKSKLLLIRTTPWTNSAFHYIETTDNEFFESYSEEKYIEKLTNWIKQGKTDRGIYDVILKEIRSNILEMEKEHDEIEVYEALNAVEYAASKIQDDTMSSQRYELLKKYMIKCNYTQHISANEIIKRAEKDQVLHFTEYRRQIIKTYAKNVDSANYDYILKCAKDKLKDKEDSVIQFEKLQAEDYIIDPFRRSANEMETLIQIIVKEKNYLNKYLKK